MGFVRNKDKKELADDKTEVLSLDRIDYNCDEATKNLLEIADKWETKYKSLRNYIYRIEAEPYFTYLDYSVHIRHIIYTTNWIERFNKR